MARFASAEVERWLRGGEHSLPFSPQWVTAVCNLNSERINALFWPMQELHKQFFKVGESCDQTSNFQTRLPHESENSVVRKKSGQSVCGSCGPFLRNWEAYVIIMRVEATEFQFSCLQFSFFWETVVPTPEMRKKQKPKCKGENQDTRKHLKSAAGAPIPSFGRGSREVR